MSPLSPNPCSMTTAGPLPPIRTWIVAPFVAMSSVRKLRGKGWTSAAAENAVTRIASTPHALIASPQKFLMARSKSLSSRV